MTDSLAPLTGPADAALEPDGELHSSGTGGDEDGRAETGVASSPAVLPPGVHIGIHGDDYHADPCERPSLSASIATILCTQSPAHARVAHPRLNPAYERIEEQKFSIGTAAHALLLEGRDAVEVIAYPDWRTKNAQALRDDARAAGRIPLLSKDWTAVQAMVEAAKTQLAQHEARPPLFTDGKPEQTLVWDDDGVLCRARLDWLRDDGAACDDLKTTSRSANPDAYSRSLFNVGGDIQAAFYLRGLRALGADYETEFRWVVVETALPHALSVISPGPDILALADAKVEYALALWRKCLATDRWPGYSAKVATAEMPAWQETQWLEREAREAAA